VNNSADKLGISHCSVHTIIHKDLQFKKICRTWVPRELMTEYMKNQVEVCIRLLEWYRKVGEAFLKRVVTRYETLVYRFEPGSKQQSMHWKHPNSPMTTKFKAQPSAGKVLLTLFWDSEGPLLEHYQVKGETLNSERYCTLLTNERKPASCTK
jgi:hypothetical protein